MNTGIQDAFNLGWRLATDDLDGYERERHPVGRTVLRSSGATIRLMTMAGARGRLARTVALRGMLRLPPVAHRGAGTFSGIAIRYPGPGPIGSRAAGIALRGPRLAERQRSAGFVTIPAEDRTDGGPGLVVRPDGYVGAVLA